MDKEIKNREELVENLLRELPLHDASDEVVSELLEKVEATPLELPLESARKNRFANIRKGLLTSLSAAVGGMSATLRRPRYASIAVAACSLLLVLSYSMDSFKQHRSRKRMYNVGNHLSKSPRNEVFSDQTLRSEGYAPRQAPADFDAEEVFSDDEVDAAADRFKADIQGSQRWREYQEAKSLVSRMGPGAPSGGSFSSAGSDRRYAKNAPAKKQEGGRHVGVDTELESVEPSSLTGGYRNDGRGESQQALEYKKFEEIDERSKLEVTRALSGERAIVSDKYSLAYSGSASSMQKSAHGTASQIGGLQTFSANMASPIGKERANKEPLSAKPKITRDGVAFKVNPRVAKGKDSDAALLARKSLPHQDPYLARRQVTPASPEPLSDVSAGYAAEEFLKRYEQLDGLRFKEASGYWSNTYVPGSPSVRRLRAKLQEMQTPSLRLPDPTLYAHDLAHQTYQPFDAPKNSALAVYLHANRTGAQGKQRMIVQVGIKASERRSGRRPAMNIGVVLDLRRLPSKEALEDMRSLLFALNKQKDIGDRFSVTIAGRDGGTLVPASKFGHGHLSVAFKNLASAPAEAGGGMNLVQAIDAARKEVSRSDDPSAPLGSSLIMLVTASSLKQQLASISQQAHAAAVEGITTSVVGVGDRLQPGELEQIALSGQGRRSILNASNDARTIIVKELNAVSQVVARAVRLRIRLAPGVQLIDVLGSQRLDAPSAERVRQAEKSIDQRISRNLGIEADRGEDEEGIQIVIPAFYAGDAHVVLLDVVAPGPGAISDVQLRYKDLVFMKNGVVRANLSLSRSEAARGPLEQNVLKNLLAYTLSEQLKVSARLIFSNQLDEARRILSEQRTLLRSFQETIPGFERDRGLRNDLLMLERYLQSLGGVSETASARPIALSLQYAGTQRVLPELLTE